mmetsp:Transcript_75770/g.133938  ORF Transcript_75770/g.133938 Transcript_75770/m.133938 type:complete len:214 (-) Transcript_75770:276-917(-)
MLMHRKLSDVNVNCVLVHAEAALHQIFVESRGQHKLVYIQPAQQLYKELYHAYTTFVAVESYNRHSKTSPSSSESELRALDSCYEFFEWNISCFHAALRRGLVAWLIRYWHMLRPDRMCLTHDLWRVILEEYLWVIPVPILTSSTPCAQAFRYLQEANGRVSDACEITLKFLQRLCNKHSLNWTQLRTVILPLIPLQRHPIGELLLQPWWRDG